jgi:hypothetical protein
MCSGVSAESGSSGTISTGPGNYYNLMDCGWTISVDNGTALLAFTEFNTEANFDFVKVYDGANSDATLLVTLSGNDVIHSSGAPKIVVGTGAELFVRFTSDFSNVKSGFVAIWYATSGASVCAPCETGKFSLAGAPSCENCGPGLFTRISRPASATTAQLESIALV